MHQGKDESSVLPTGRLVRRALGFGTLALSLAAIWKLRAPAKVGHWRSSIGHDAFMALYGSAFQALPRPSATIDVRTGYGVVRIYRFKGADTGEKPLVLLPGRASATPVWADFLPHLLSFADLYAVDLLGEPGMSVQERPIESDLDQALWLDQALSKLPETGFNVVGLSIGGWTATNLALLRPARVASLTLIDPMNVLADLPMQTILRSIPVSLPTLPKAWRDGFNSWTAGGAPVVDDPVGRMIESGMANYALRLPQPRRIHEDELHGLRMPLLAIVAGRSVMHHGTDARDAATRVFGAGAVRYYPQASHAITGEHPTEIATDIAAFLETTRGSDRRSAKSLVATE